MRVIIRLCNAHNQTIYYNALRLGVHEFILKGILLGAIESSQFYIALVKQMKM